MNNIEFGKKMQELAKNFETNTGEKLGVSINLETGYLSSKVYCGKDYPQDREKLIKFMEEKIKEYLNNL